jgi:hypothetical protein
MRLLYPINQSDEFAISNQMRNKHVFKYCSTKYCSEVLLIHNLNLLKKLAFLNSY